MSKKIVYHTHHIIPKHMGGSNDPDNLIKLTVEEHAEAHRKLYEQYGNKFDRIAFLVLSKQIGVEEANYMKLLGPKNWTAEGKENLRKAASQRKGNKNGFYGKTHTDATKNKISESLSGDNSWIKNIDPALLPYTKKYIIIYPNGKTKEVAGLKVIAEEFNVSIENVHATIKRISMGKLPKRGVFANTIIREVI